MKISSLFRSFIFLIAASVFAPAINAKSSLNGPSPADGTINGHGYVDLGLPSGTMWATCNVGATAPEGYGNYYAWGETTPKSEYTKKNSRTCNNGGYRYTISGKRDLDAATANWGASWRLPTKAQFDELLNNTSTKWTAVNGIKGRLFTSKINGKSIFIPAAGNRLGSTLKDTGSDGSYWSGSPYEIVNGNIYVYYIGFDDEPDINWFWRICYFGRPVRPVAASPKAK